MLFWLLLLIWPPFCRFQPTGLPQLTYCFGPTGPTAPPVVCFVRDSSASSFLLLLYPAVAMHITPYSMVSYIILCDLDIVAYLSCHFRSILT